MGKEDHEGRIGGPSAPTMALPASTSSPPAGRPEREASVPIIEPGHRDGRETQVALTLVSVAGGPVAFAFQAAAGNPFHGTAPLRPRKGSQT